MRRFGFGLLGLLLLAGCAGDRDPPPGQPAFYVSMANPDAQLDSNVAASMISGYRQNNGLSAVTVDPQLSRAAQRAGRGDGPAQQARPRRDRRPRQTGQISGI